MAPQPPVPENNQDNSPLLPPWVHTDCFFKKLPKHHRQAILEVIQPLYERFVLHPADHVERSTGSSVIFLLWTELLKQAEIATAPYDGDSVHALRRRMLMDDLFLIIGPKSRMSALLVRIRQSNSKLEPPQPYHPFPDPLAALPAPVP